MRMGRVRGRVWSRWLVPAFCLQRKGAMLGLLLPTGSARRGRVVFPLLGAWKTPWRDGQALEEGKHAAWAASP